MSGGAAGATVERNGAGAGAGAPDGRGLAGGPGPERGAAERVARFRELVDGLRDEVREGGRLRRDLPGGGRLHLDRRLPYLLVHRSGPDGSDPGTARLVRPASSHLLAPADPALRPCVSELVEAIVRDRVDALGAFLLIELWAGPRPADEDEDRPVPRLRLHLPDEAAPWADDFARALGGACLRPRRGGALGIALERPEVELRAHSSAEPPGGGTLAADPPAGLHRVGIETEPFYRSPEGCVYPRITEAAGAALTEALYRGVFAFAQEETELDAPHPRALGRRTISSEAREVDARLGEVSAAFDLLLQVTPINGEEAFEEFRAAGFRRAPEFVYRPLPFDPERLKRALFGVPVSEIEDPLLGFLFREKQEELDREISLLRDRDTPRFLPGSVQLYGAVDAGLLERARAVLERLPAESVAAGEEYGGEEASAGPDDYVDAEAFARAARLEIERYRAAAPFDARVEIRGGLAAGLMVSGDTLLVSRDLSLPRGRVDALVQHEVGTHLLTRCNGRAQPFGQFATGLAGYDPLQEGLAVLAEYIVGGLTCSRMRVLAARVLAVESVLAGADFVDTFRLLVDGRGFGERAAFVIALRVHRGGGMTKDAAYLRGLTQVLEYLRGGGGLDPLWVGKLGRTHLEVAQELMLRGILRLPMVKPRWLEAPGAAGRLEACRAMTIEDLVEECSG